MERGAVVCLKSYPVEKVFSFSLPFILFLIICFDGVAVFVKFDPDFYSLEYGLIPGIIQAGVYFPNSTIKLVLRSKVQEPSPSFY